MFNEILENLYSMTAFQAIAENPLFLVMYLLASCSCTWVS